MKISRFHHARLWVCFALPSLLLGGCKMLAGLPVKETPNEVFVMGTLHGDHLEEEIYTLERVGEIVRRVDPSVVLVEIPPDRYSIAWGEFLRTGEVADEQVKLYPEFTEVIFPIALEGRFQVVPCSAWTSTMAERRSSLLLQWKTSRPADSRVVDQARDRASKRLEEAGLAHDPLLIHSAEYDALVEAGMQPYERLFDRDLGDGGWKEINHSHYGRIATALDSIRWEGRRVLIIFGSWHKGRLRELLEQRDDIVLRRLSELLEAQ